MKLTSTLAILSTISTLSFAFVLDYSCSAYQSMILPALAGAFDYTQAGADTLNNLATSNKGSGDIWQAQRDLINYTLADTLTNNEIDTTNLQWKTANDTFNSALKFNTNNAVTNKPSAYYLLKPDAVVIFCDYSRFHENHDCNGKSKPGWVCDKALMIDTPFLQGYDNCKTSAPNTARSTKAWVARLTPANRASTIQLCPGYLEEMVLYQKAMYNQQGRVFNLGKYIRPGPYPTRIDMLKTFDVSLAHEMIHAVENVEIKDIELPNSYMWPNVRRLSSKGTRNADNYAYFGLGSRLISPVAQPNGMRPQAVRPMADGSLQDLDGGSKRDVSNGDNLFGPRAMNQITTSSSDDTTASSLSGISTLAPAPTGSSCSPQVTSGCVLSYSIVTPTGASTAELSTITVSCTTITTCSVSLTDAASVTATPIYDQDVSEAWYATQENVLSEAATDTMDHYKTWSSDESTQAAATTQPASSSASIEDDC